MIKRIIASQFTRDMNATEILSYFLCRQLATESMQLNGTKVSEYQNGKWVYEDFKYADWAMTFYQDCLNAKTAAYMERLGLIGYILVDAVDDRNTPCITWEEWMNS